MSKNMYSLMLMDEVVREVDRLAYEQGTNRSNLVNRILAEYLSVRTPEMHIREIFDMMTARMEAFGGFKIQAPSSDAMLSIKSPLEYKYRPTIRYSLELFRSDKLAAGELRVVFRTQSEDLLSRISEFFELWINLERHYIHKYFPSGSIKYTLEEGRFRRSMMLPKGNENLSGESLGQAISEYIRMFDEILKLYLYNSLSRASDIEKRYVEYLSSGMIII